MKRKCGRKFKAVDGPDYYDKAVAFLTEHPDQIDLAWSNHREHRCGKLFAYCGDGCPTMIKGGDFNAITPELTRSIRQNGLIPQSNWPITPASLVAFAEIQRTTNTELNIKPPEWEPTLKGARLNGKPT